MYRKSIRRKRYESKAVKCATMRAAKERKRIEQAASMRDVGGFVTDGCLGNHAVRLLAYPGDTRHLAVVLDGRHRQARTLAGIKRCMAEMIRGKICMT